VIPAFAAAAVRGAGCGWKGPAGEARSHGDHRGTPRDDTLVGTMGGDTIHGYGGHDRIYADLTVYDHIGRGDAVDGGDGDELIYTYNYSLTAF
jgi:hypothetical protein